MIIDVFEAELIETHDSETNYITDKQFNKKIKIFMETLNNPDNQKQLEELELNS